MKLVTKLYLFIGGIVVVALAALGLYIYSFMQTEITDSLNESISAELNYYAQMVDLEVKSKKEQVRIAINFANNYLASLGSITELPEKTSVAEHSVNKWMIKGQVVQNSSDIVDYVKKNGGADVVTIFQKTPNGYLRVSTNVITREGKVATGTVIGFDSPVAQALERGETYVGRAYVVDTWYRTIYEPIRINGEIKGAFFVGVNELEYDALSQYFKNSISKKTGYSYIVNSEGLLTAHPASVGTNISGEEFFKRMVEKKNGTIKYVWQGRDKGQSFRYLEEIDSYLGTTWYVDDFEAAITTLKIAIFIAVIITLALVIGTILLIVRDTQKQLGADPKEVQEIANKVAEGNFDIEVKIKLGDTNSLAASMDKMMQTIKRMVSDTKQLSDSAIAGKLDARADSSRFQGQFKELVAGINATLDAVIKPLNVTAEYVDRISKGDIPPKITDEYRGDFNEIKNNLNTCIDALNGLIDDMINTTKLQREGDIEAFANTDKYHGIYKNLVAGYNEGMQIHINAILEIINSLNSYAQGDLSKEMRILPGKQIILTTTINTLRQNILNLVTDANMLAKAADEGKLDVRANATLHGGDFRRIIEGFNETLNLVVEPITEAGEVLGAMAGGNLTVRMLGSYKGNLLALKNDINTLADSLNDMLAQVNQVVHNSASSAVEISSTADGLAAATQEQSAQADEVASAVEEMSRTITENAMGANKTAEMAQMNGNIATEGGAVVSQTVAKMRDIAKVVRNSAENIEKLGESSKQIGEIISVIDDIADQTNLLALNAAIEAARAGEQGRGFAVVADEVRKLAERTTEATKQIANMIKGIQSETQEAVVAMNKGTEEVQSGIELADKAGESLQQILASTRDLMDMINQIAAASEEQSSTSEQISKNVVSISKVTAESAHRIEDVAHTADELAKMTEQLSMLMKQFKIEDGSNAFSHAHRQLGHRDQRKLTSPSEAFD